MAGTSGPPHPRVQEQFGRHFALRVRRDRGRLTVAWQAAVLRRAVSQMRQEIAQNVSALSRISESSGADAEGGSVARSLLPEGSRRKKGKGKEVVKRGL